MTTLPSLLLMLATASAPPLPPEQNIMPIMARATMEGIHAACQAADAGTMPDEYAREFLAWKQRNAESLAAQEAYARATIEDDGRSKWDKARELTLGIVADFLAKPPETRVPGCRKLLLYMETDLGMHAPDATTLASIARGIESLKDRYPQLAEFSAAANLDADTLRIDYAHRTHQASATGGWTSGVPNPDDDGVWFHIDFHDPASTAQIHTQPMVGPAQCLRDRRVSFLILEGAKTQPVGQAIRGVLGRHGITDCAPKP